MVDRPIDSQHIALVDQVLDRFKHLIARACDGLYFWTRLLHLHEHISFVTDSVRAKGRTHHTPRDGCLQPLRVGPSRWIAWLPHQRAAKVEDGALAIRTDDGTS
jgi:hypothetical protein